MSMSPQNGGFHRCTGGGPALARRLRFAEPAQAPDPAALFPFCDNGRHILASIARHIRFDSGVHSA